MMDGDSLRRKDGSTTWICWIGFSRTGCLGIGTVETTQPWMSIRENLTLILINFIQNEHRDIKKTSDSNFR